MSNQVLFRLRSKTKRHGDGQIGFGLMLLSILTAPMSKPPDGPEGSPPTPTVLYNGMIAPIIPFAIKGVVWYQGEGNAGNATEYRTLSPG